MSQIDESELSLGIVIATRNRPESIRACLQTINTQTVLPETVVVVDSSANQETREVLESVTGKVQFACVYQFSSVASAAVQRNVGVNLCGAAIILLLDDDVVLEPNFCEEILQVFRANGGQRLGGVSGTISNQVYSDPRGLNRILLGMCLGRFKGSFAGRVLGPAVNFLPADSPDLVQQVEWLPTTCTAYPRDVFLAHRFEETFEGYSFAEDLHLSTRIGRTHRLMNTTRARVFHADLGKDTHRDWVALGESQVRNRFLIMTGVLGRKRILDHARLFAFEMVYSSVAWLAAGASAARISILARLLRGKVNGFSKSWGSERPPASTCAVTKTSLNQS